jgi:proline iminopeptidase
MFSTKTLFILGLIIIFLGVLVIFALGLHRPTHFIANFEEEEYAGDSYLEPAAILDGLAVYDVGQGDPVLLIPYPHGHTEEPMAQGDIADLLLQMGRRVISFDVPGAYRSTREPVGDMDEMIRSADETLDYLGIDDPVDVVGHSMSGFVALAYAIERPERVEKLVLANSVSGFPAAVRCGFPGSAFSVFEPDYWRVILWGMQLNGGRGNLALHKNLQNLMQRAAFHDETFFTPVEIDLDDYDKGVPIRTIWSKNMYNRLSYADRLNQVQASTLILAGRHDPEASLECSRELFDGIPEASLIIFEQSGHAPFIEENSLFQQTLEAFLKEEEGSP